MASDGQQSGFAVSARMEDPVALPLLGNELHKESKQDRAKSLHNTQVSRRICGTVCGFSDARTQVVDLQARSVAARKLIIAVGLCVIFIAVEVAGGLVSRSLAVLTDAAHLLSDAASFAISLFAIWASGWEATPRQSYGYFRLEILGALLSIQLIWLITGIIVYEAVYRISHTMQPVDGRLMFIVASFGLCINLSMIFLLGDHEHIHGNHTHGHSHGNHHARGHNHGYSHVHGHGRIQAHISEQVSEETSKSLEHSNDHDQDHRHHRNDDVIDHVHSCGCDHDHDHVHGHDGHVHNCGCDHDHVHHGHDGDHDGHAHHHNDVTHDHVHILDPDHDHSYDHQHGGQREDDIEVDIDINSVDVLHKGSGQGNINVRGAFLHALGDSIQSVGVMIGGAIIWIKPEWRVVDLICTFLFSALVLSTTIRILRDIVEILMESTPREIDPDRLEKGLCDIPGVKSVHELHIWAITMGKTLLACHVMIFSDADGDAILQRVLGYCERVFNIRHATVQIERHQERL